MTYWVVQPLTTSGHSSNDVVKVAAWKAFREDMFLTSGLVRPLDRHAHTCLSYYLIRLQYSLTSHDLFWPPPMNWLQKQIAFG